MIGMSLDGTGHRSDARDVATSLQVVDVVRQAGPLNTALQIRDARQYRLASHLIHHEIRNRLRKMDAPAFARRFIIQLPECLLVSFVPRYRIQRLRVEVPFIKRY